MTRAERNKLFPKEGFADYVRWHCETMKAITDVVGGFQEKDSLEALNQEIERVYQERTEELAVVLGILKKSQ